MNEIPTSLDTSIIETPVPDPDLFLLHKVNQQYLAGNRARPHLSKPQGSIGKYWWFFAVGLYLFCMVCGGFDVIFRWLGTITLPSLPDLTTPTEEGMLVFFLILFLMGITVVLRDMWEARKKATPVSPSIHEKPITVSSSAPKAQVLNGTVVKAEKIRGNGIELLGVRYQFAAPGGIIRYGYSEALSEDASHAMAPPPGTRVKVYYTEKGKHYLL
jgi:hypothetical protein